jgi:fatty-acyl-CoA synthase
MAAVIGTNVCLRRIDVRQIYEVIAAEKVTHFCGAPIVHNMLMNAPAEVRALKTHIVEGFIAGAAPPAAIIEGMEKNGFKLTHVYGLTETYGPSVVCEWHDEWDELDASQIQSPPRGAQSHVRRLDGCQSAEFRPCAT